MWIEIADSCAELADSNASLVNVSKTAGVKSTVELMNSPNSNLSYWFVICSSDFKYTGDLATYVLILKASS